MRVWGGTLSMIIAYPVVYGVIGACGGCVKPVVWVPISHCQELQSMQTIPCGWS